MGDISTDIGNFFYNAWTGNVSPGQKAALVAQEQAQFVQAGMDPTSAQSQAQSDVTASLETYAGSGGLDVSWTGADPAQSGFVPAAATQAVDVATQSAANILAPSLAAVPSWLWWVGGGLAAYFGLKAAKDVL
jgi:hypothetical protein